MSEIRLILGDALGILPTLDCGHITMITDPPYGVALTLHGSRKGAPRYKEILGDQCQSAGIAVLNWAAEANYCAVAFANPMQPWPGKWRQHLVWDKGPAVGGYGDYRRCWKATWELIQVARNPPLEGSRDEAVIRDYPVSPGTKDHPAEKPVELLCYLIEQITLPGWTVVDPFMGSGTTGVACVQTGRNFIGIEIDENYFNIAKKRVEAAQNAAPLFEPARPVQAEMFSLAQSAEK